MRRDSLQRLDAHIGKRLKQLRTASKLSLGKVGEIIEVSPQHLSRVEKGERKLNAGQLYQLARGLDVPVSYFFEGFTELKDEKKRLASFLKNSTESWKPHTDEEIEQSLLKAWRTLSSKNQRESALKMIESMAYPD